MKVFVAFAFRERCWRRGRSVAEGFSLTMDVETITL